ncbi:type IV toxin-antitoxin system AbiEi family antitoxin domain-containing protein [Williamsia maris]|uniref:type IV toxin-antitoxin system AbiEi family antitoxin domain-containing protein n=1 Tax=Williamsia maris TaxID=72806 RepID=UPI0020A3F234|nr:hypothetical protein [Williamsia maris]
MNSFPIDRHGLVHRSNAVQSGHTDAQLARAVAAGELTRVMRGVFTHRSDRTPEQAHRLMGIATGSPDGSVVVSHQSAATLHRLEMLRPQLRRVHLTVGNGVKAHRTAVRHEHEAHLADHEVTTIDGVLVTSLERTAVDVARTTSMGFAGALAVLDSALRLGADRSVMASMMLTARRGVAQARRALHHADGNAENPGESWSRAQMINAGLPPARLQHRFRSSTGELLARTDFDWAGLLVGEFDGMVKYQKLLRPGETPFDAMRREKEREDALRRAGIMVIRWTWTDLERGRVVPMVRDWLLRFRLVTA